MLTKKQLNQLVIDLLEMGCNADDVVRMAANTKTSD